jgi:hypothetical protein
LSPSDAAELRTIVLVCPSPVTALQSWRVVVGGGARWDFPTAAAETAKLAKMLATMAMMVTVTATTMA